MDQSNSLCNRAGCTKHATNRVAMKLWPSGHLRGEHNFLVVELGLQLCNEHMVEVSSQGRAFFLFNEQSRETINTMVTSRGAAVPDWGTAELYAIPIDGSVVIDSSSSVPTLPAESSDEPSQKS